MTFCDNKQEFFKGFSKKYLPMKNFVYTGGWFVDIDIFYKL